MGSEQSLKFLLRRQDRELANLAEERLHFARRLEHIHHLSRLVAHAGPDMVNLARCENGLPCPQTKLIVAYLKIKLTIDDIKPLILIMVDVARRATFARRGKLENTERTICVLRRYLAIVRGAAQFDVFTESIAASRHTYSAF